MILPTLAAALVTRWSALSPLVAAGVQVRRGAPVGGFGPGNWLMVEYDGRPDSEADSRFDWNFTDLAGTSVEERGEITCSSMSQSGDTAEELAAREVQALAQLGACIADLASDRTAGGVVMNAQIISGSATQLQNTQGIAVVVPFVVAYYGTYAASAA